MDGQRLQAFVGQAVTDKGAISGLWLHPWRPTGPAQGDGRGRPDQLVRAGAPLAAFGKRWPRTAPCCTGRVQPRATATPTNLILETNRKWRHVMNTESSVTETVVRNHLQAFVDQRGIDAIVRDYDESARLYSEAKIYEGKQQIAGFFADFLAALPDGSIDRFTLRSFWAHGHVAYITWSAGPEIPLGTDTFVVNNGKISSQTYAMYAAALR